MVVVEGGGMQRGVWLWEVLKGARGAQGMKALQLRLMNECTLGGGEGGGRGRGQGLQCLGVTGVVCAKAAAAASLHCRCCRATAAPTQDTLSTNHKSMPPSVSLLHLPCMHHIIPPKLFSYNSPTCLLLLNILRVTAAVIV